MHKKPKASIDLLDAQIAALQAQLENETSLFSNDSEEEEEDERGSAETEPSPPTTHSPQRMADVNVVDNHEHDGDLIAPSSGRKQKTQSVKATNGLPSSTTSSASLEKPAAAAKHKNIKRRKDPVATTPTGPMKSAAMATTNINKLDRPNGAVVVFDGVSGRQTNKKRPEQNDLVVHPVVSKSAVDDVVVDDDEPLLPIPPLPSHLLPQPGAAKRLKVSSGPTRCYTCNQVFESYSKFKEHAQSLEHRQNVAVRAGDAYESVHRPNYCRACQMQFDTVDDLVRHRQSGEHKTNQKKIDGASFCALCRKAFTSPLQYVCCGGGPVLCPRPIYFMLLGLNRTNVVLYFFCNNG